MKKTNMNRKIAVIGLGYVGLPMAVEFGKIHPIIGFDIKQRRIDELRSGIDATLEVEPSVLKMANILYTANVEDLKAANFFIIAVPTPVDTANKPDLTPLIKASETVGKALKKGDIVVYESTVYPGATEEDCVPVLERVSGLQFGTDFSIGYSPERINPGDKEHTFTKIRKVVAGSDSATLDAVDAIYSSVVTAGTFRASSIKVAEAAKVIENTQRDLNIALMNELAVIFKRMDIDTNEVIEAAGSKWNFLKFRPGLVGGHCIGVDPYYLTYKAEKLGYIPQVILAGRRINDGMARFVAQEFVKELIQSGVAIKGQDVVVFGLTFKENCPDLRNSKVADLVRELKTYGLNVWVHDPMADSAEAKHEYGIELTPLEKLPRNAIGAVVAVAHSSYLATPAAQLFACLSSKAVVADIKGIIKPLDLSALGHTVWRL
jgi:UDP-N-acetyl-D-glucosamine/UDP-N-acetyl-D-galactosamine dehydrogenase